MLIALSAQAALRHTGVPRPSRVQCSGNLPPFAPPPDVVRSASHAVAAKTLHAALCGQVSGSVVDPQGQPLKGLRLAGKWDHEIVAHMPDGSSRVLWRVHPPAADPSRCR